MFVLYGTGAWTNREGHTKEWLNKPHQGETMTYANELKTALKDLQQFDGVEHCWFEEEGGEIFHVYTATKAADYAIQKRVFQKYAEIEQRFPKASFEFRTTSLDPPQTAEVVF